MSYRVEMSKSGRAGCTSTECKKAGIKIDKDELRLGVWVPFEDRGSWKWRHWGCVTGKMIQNIRNKLEIRPGDYDWDALDGYDEPDDKSSLSRYPDMQEKVRRVIEQGFIDADDFNGDPEMNKLGETGLRTKETKKQMRQDDLARTHEIDELKAKIASLEAELAVLKSNGGSTTKIDNQLKAISEQLTEKEEAATPAATPAKKKAAPKKRGRADESGDEGLSEAPTPAKKKPATKAKKEVDEDGEEVKPAPKKSRAKKVKAEEAGENGEEEAKPAPTKKSRAKKAVKQEEDEEMEDAEPYKPAPSKSRGKKAVKPEDVDNAAEDEEVKPAPAKKSRAKKTVKQEEGEGEAAAAPAPKKRAARGKKAVKDEPVEDTTMTGGEPPTAADSTANTTLPEDPGATVKGEPSDAINLNPDTAIVGANAEDTEKAEGDAKCEPSEAVTAVPENAESGVKGEPSDAVDLPTDASMADAEPAAEIDESAKLEPVKEEQPADGEPAEDSQTSTKKGPKGKKTPATKGSRASRSRTASSKA